MKNKFLQKAFIKSFLFFLFSIATSFVFAQTGDVSGKVSNKDDSPLAGATVKIKGAKTATTTNQSGIFTLKNVAASGVLEISYVGYLTDEVKYTAGKQADVALTEKPADVEEVIVTGVFDKRKKMDASVAITTISAKQISRIVLVSAADLLKNVPGVYVNSSLGEIRNTVYSRGVSVGSNDGASGYYYVSMQEDGLPVTNVTYGNYGPDYFLRPDATLGKLEAVRGGTASITSTNAPGGVFNYVSKEGGGAFGGEVVSKYGLEGNGHNNFYRTDFSLGGPLAGGWSYNIGGFYRYAQGARYPGYPINNGGQLKGNLVKKYKTGSLKFYGKYLNDNNGWFEFTPTESYTDPKPATGFTNSSSVLMQPVRQTFPINATGNTGTYNNPDLIHSKYTSVGFNWEQHFGTGWTFNNAMRYSNASAFWNTNAIVYPLNMEDLVSYAILGLLGKPGTYSFRGLNSGKELLSVKSYSGFDFHASNSTLPGNAIAPNSLFFEPMLYQTNGVKEFLDQFSFTKKFSNMTLVGGGFYGSSKVDRLGGIAGLGLGTIQNRPELVNITLSNPDSTVSHVSNGNGIMGIGSALSLNSGTQNQLALFFGHNWQIDEKFNLDWGVRYENVAVKGQNSPGVTTQSKTGGLDGDPLTLYDNSIGSTPATYLFDKKLSTFSYSVGLNYKINNHYSFYGRYTVGNKAPDLDMYFNANTAFTSENLNPVAQKVQQAELGFKARVEKLNLFVTPFYSLLSNVPNVQTFQNADQTFYSPLPIYNKFRTIGVEVEADYTIQTHFNIRGVLTLQNSKAVDYSVWLANGFGPADDSLVYYSGNETDNIPKTILNITPSYNVDKFYAQLTWSFMGKRQANTANAFLLPSFNQFNLAAGYDFSKSFQLSFNVNNLFNTYGVMSWSRPGSFLEALDRQGFTKEMYNAAVAGNTPYSTVAIAARAFYLTATFKF